VTFGRAAPDEVRLPYGAFEKPGVRFLRETITAIDPEARRARLLVMPFGTPVPPSPDTSTTLLAAFAERGIEFVAGRRVSSLDPTRSVAVLDDGTELPYDLFLGVPKHRAPRRRRLPLRAEAHRHVPGAVARPRRREAALRREPPRPLVQPLTLTRSIADDPARRSRVSIARGLT